MPHNELYNYFHRPGFPFLKLGADSSDLDPTQFGLAKEDLVWVLDTGLMMW